MCVVLTKCWKEQRHAFDKHCLGVTSESLRTIPHSFRLISHPFRPFRPHFSYISFISRLFRIHSAHFAPISHLLRPFRNYFGGRCTNHFASNFPLDALPLQVDHVDLVHTRHERYDLVQAVG